MVRRWTIVAAFMVGACGGVDDADAGAWELEVDTVQAGGTTRQTSWLRVVGREGPEGDARAREVMLSFDCIPDQASSTIMTEQALRQGTTEVRLTLDGQAPLEMPAFAGTTPTGGQVVLTIPQDSLLGLLGTHGRAVVEYADGAGSSRTTAEFPLAGLETHRATFQAACAKRGG